MDQLTNNSHYLIYSLSCCIFQRYPLGVLILDLSLFEATGHIRVWHLDFQLRARKGPLMKISGQNRGYIVIIHTISGP